MSSSDKEPFGGDATSTNSVDAGPQPKNEIPDASNTGKENRESKDSNDGGKRFGNCVSRSCSRDSLFSRRIATPCAFNFDVNASTNTSVLSPITSGFNLTNDEYKSIVNT